MMAGAVFRSSRCACARARARVREEGGRVYACMYMHAHTRKHAHECAIKTVGGASHAAWARSARMRHPQEAGRTSHPLLPRDRHCSALHVVCADGRVGTRPSVCIPPGGVGRRGAGGGAAAGRKRPVSKAPRSDASRAHDTHMHAEAVRMHPHTDAQTRPPPGARSHARALALCSPCGENLLTAASRSSRGVPPASQAGHPARRRRGPGACHRRRPHAARKALAAMRCAEPAARRWSAAASRPGAARSSPPGARRTPDRRVGETKSPAPAGPG